MALVSVIISTYNYGCYLATAIDSVIGQTLVPFEVIVINDGSKDNTDQVMERYRDYIVEWRDETQGDQLLVTGDQQIESAPLTSKLRTPSFPTQIRYIKQKNRGQGKAKNRGSRMAQGEFVAFLDADDYWHPEKLQKQMPLFSDECVGVVYSRSVNVDPAGIIVSGKKLRMYRGMITKKLLFTNFVPFSSSVVRKTVLDEYNHQDEEISIGTDWDLFLRISTQYKFDYVDEPLEYYRVGNTGKLSSNIDKRFFCADQVKTKFFATYLSFKYLERRKWARGYLDRSFRYLANGDLEKADQNSLKGFKIYPLYLLLYCKYLFFRVRKIFKNHFLGRRKR
jgi:glycosyltransferase involved in cell wall biosynthesis